MAARRIYTILVCLLPFTIKRKKERRERKRKKASLISELRLEQSDEQQYYTDKTFYGCNLQPGLSRKKYAYHKQTL